MGANEDLRQRSGNVVSTDPLVSLLYSLLRDHISPGDLEQLVQELEKNPADTTLFSNGWLAQYAGDLATRIRAAGEIPINHVD